MAQSLRISIVEILACPMQQLTQFKRRTGREEKQDQFTRGFWYHSI